MAKKKKNTKISVGNDVKWVSHGGAGRFKAKKGEVVAIVRAGYKPKSGMFPGLRIRPEVESRSVTSYVVNVKGKHYWPFTSQLRKV